MNHQQFRFIQLAVFLVITFVVGTAVYYFPNLPPVLRPFLHKGSIEISKETKPDKRFMQWFDRDPERNIPIEEGIIVAPADGVVMAVQDIGDRKHIVIEMRYTDVHVQRIPISGVVISIDGDGKRLPEGMKVGEYALNKMLPYQKATTLRTEIGEVKIRQITSFFANRIIVYPEVGQDVKIGERLGRILAGSTVVIELPELVVPIVKAHQDVLAGETIIARYKKGQ